MDTSHSNLLDTPIYGAVVCYVTKIQIADMIHNSSKIRKYIVYSNAIYYKHCITAVFTFLFECKVIEKITFALQTITAGKQHIFISLLHFRSVFQTISFIEFTSANVLC